MIVAVAIALAVSFALAAPLEAAEERALAVSFEDAELKWGPCPELMPKGCQIAVLHGDPAKENADIFLKVPAGVALPRHYHTSAERMVLVSGAMTVTYDGQPAVVLKPGMYAYGPAKRPHKASCGAGEPCVLFIAFEQAVDVIGE
ncbi:MAG TPA: cupin domain-containing protein [Terriglobales bacterium]|nr:cupin domain-containing protein [Terriglobales bacterium]